QSTGALDDAPVDDDARLDFFADRKIDDIILSASRAGPPLSRSHRRRARIDDYRRMSRVAVFGARALLIRRGANVNARAHQPFFDYLKQRDASPVFQLRDRNASGRRVDQSRD